MEELGHKQTLEESLLKMSDEEVLTILTLFRDIAEEDKNQTDRDIYGAAFSEAYKRKLKIEGQ